MTNILPISNIINVTIENIPTGLTEPNVNSMALFTNETPNNLNPYGIYVSAAQVAADYGTNSVTAAMANAIFAQVPNILSGTGQLVIIPLLSSVSATSGTGVTPSISANLSNLIAVSNGDITVTVDGHAYALANLNFTGCATLADIATVLQAALVNCVVTAQANTITFTSKKVGTASTVAFSANAAGGTDLTGATLLHTGTAVDTAGANSTGETILAAIARTSQLVSYCPIMTNLNLEDTAITTIATGIQALNNLFFHHCSSTADIAGVCTTIQQALETKTRMLLYTPGQTQANLMKAAYAGRACSVDFTGSNTDSTMNLKTLATIVPDPGVTQTLYNAASTAGVDLYVSYAGVPAVFSTGGNDFFDNQYANLAMLFAFETAGFNYLAQTNTKVPQTEQGMNGLKDAYIQVCQQFVTNGELAPGQWNSSETFGDPAIFNQNIVATGYYVYSQPVATQSSSARNARVAPLVQIALKRAGAIHSGNVIVLVNN